MNTWSLEEADPLGYAPKRRWIVSALLRGRASIIEMNQPDMYLINLLGVGDHAYWPGEAVKGFLAAQVRALELLGVI
jgi:hypothetical protein